VLPGAFWRRLDHARAALRRAESVRPRRRRRAWRDFAASLPRIRRVLLRPGIPLTCSTAALDGIARAEHALDDMVVRARLSAPRAAATPDDKISQQLRDVLAAAAPTDLIPIFIGVTLPRGPTGAPIDDNMVVDRGATLIELRTNLFHFWQIESYEASRALSHDLTLLGCTKINTFWSIPDIFASCTPDVIRELAGRAPIVSLEWDGPIIVG
jgi:hypothetical protein